jgi:hypothetical protein
MDEKEMLIKRECYSREVKPRRYTSRKPVCVVRQAVNLVSVDNNLEKVINIDD